MRRVERIIIIVLCANAFCIHGNAQKADTLKTWTDKVHQLSEVVVTAQESKGLSSSSLIQRQAMQHLQPSSFADILELLPGGRALDPSLSVPNIISLREVPVSNSDYLTSALGTRFLVDGAPISVNANMQYLSGATDSKSTSRSYVNAGVDMRSISTDDIDEVEIVRGIPSVEYGDLTSGLIKIKRRKGGNFLQARFKADMDTKLFYVSKAFDFEPQNISLNVSADYLNNEADPRNILENFKRFNFSARLAHSAIWRKWKVNSGLNFDYGTIIDGDKVDPELNYGGVDSYRQRYNRYALNGSMEFKNLKYDAFFTKASLLASLSYENNLIERTRLVQLHGETAASVNKEGEHVAQLIYPYTYTASHSVDGKPFNFFLKAKGNFSLPSMSFANNMIVGADLQIDKNYGEGQLFDALYPLYPGSDSRERAYKDIPGTYNLGCYVEEKIGVPLGKAKLDVQGGVRAEKLLGLGSRYAMHGKWYLDPRVNIGVSFPAFMVAGRNMLVSVDAGVGLHTKFPTISQLYPDKTYIDLVELNYYHANREYREMVVQTYPVDPTNYDLHPARNKKWEARTNVSWMGNRLSITYFQELMTSGFRTASVYNPYSFKIYDASGIDDGSISQAPDYTLLPYTTSVVCRAYGSTTNGSTTDKRGIEYTLSTRRFPVVNTRLTITGAWFRTEYHNSQPVMYKPSVLINGKELQVVGIYNDDDGYIREMTNTNFTLDTDVPRIKMGVSLSAQCVWMTAKQSMYKNSFPVAYMNESGEVLPYTDECKDDAVLSRLNRSYNDAAFDRQTVPFCMNLNLKATKKLCDDKLMIALFVNKLWDAHPDYERNGFVIRRYVTPYFGLEMNVKL